MIKLLDCTLRDGGYVCNWTFGHNSILNIYHKLQMSKVDIIELGYLRDYEMFSMDRTSIPSVKDVDRIYNIQKNTSAMLVAMIDFGSCKIENICESRETIVDGIRLTFKKTRIDDALAFAEAVKAKGYKIFLQPVSIMDYTDAEMIALLKKIDAFKPYAVSIVDTYGLMFHKDLSRFYKLMDEHLSHDITIGYHPHNSFQLAYSHAIELIEKESNRDLIIDATVQGMGKDSGNVATELIAYYLNSKDERYDINYLLEIMKTELSLISSQPTWGYSLVSFLSCSNKCRTEYAKHLLAKNTLSIAGINTIISRIEPAKRTTEFHKEYVEQLYREFQSKDINDEEALFQLQKKIGNRKVMLLAPGLSIKREYDKLQEYIKRECPVIISVNFPPDGYRADLIFFSNNQRYGRSVFEIDSIDKKEVILLTSNIDENYEMVRGVLNYSSLIENDDYGVLDNALVLLVKALIRMNVKTVDLAGFDGFTEDGKNDYKAKDLKIKHENVSEINDRIRQFIRKIKKNINVNFLTTSLYDTQY